MSEQPKRELHLTGEELRFLQLLVARNDLATSAQIEDRGRDGLLVTMFDKTGHEVGRHEMRPGNYELP